MHPQFQGLSLPETRSSLNDCTYRGTSIGFRAMMPALVSLLAILRDSFRTRVALQAEILALRHQLLISPAQEPEAAPAVVGRRSSPLGLALPCVAGLEIGTSHRAA
jgi:hypothetical protein